MRSTFAQSIRRSLVFSSSSSSLGYLTSPFDSFFAACARDFVWDSSSNSFQHNAIRIYCFRIVFSRFESIRVKSKLRSNQIESGDSGGSAKRGRRRAWKCELSRNMLVYRINIRRAYPPWAEGEKEGEEEGMGRGSLKPRNTETRNPLESLEFTARHIGCESTRN